MKDEKFLISNEDEFSFIDFLKKDKKRLFLILLASFLYAFASTSILTKASTIPTGLSAISMTLSFILPILKPYLNLIYLALNIPLFLFFWKKIKKQYIYLTLIFLISNAIIGFLIAFDFGYYINGKTISIDFLISQYIIIFCPPSNQLEHAYATTHGLNNLMDVKLNDYFNWIEQMSIDIFNELPVPIKYATTGITIGVEKGWPIFVYMLTGVVLCASSAAIAWKCGSSTGGTDIIAYYFSTKKKKSVGSLLTIIGAIIASSSLIIIWSLSSFSVPTIQKNINGFDSLVSLQTLSSIIYVVLFGKILNMLYPKYKKVLVRIDTLNVDVIKKFLSEIDFKHAYKIYTLTSGRTGQNIYTFETIVLLLESEELVRKIKTVDSTAWVSKLDVKKIYGRFNYSSVE